MNWLNYHHLLYFWTVAREGSIARACTLLHLTQPTISGQLRSLEKALGAKLFNRVGRNLVLSETGQIVYRYADDIFSLGRELQDTLKGQPAGRPLRSGRRRRPILLIGFRLPSSSNSRRIPPP